MSTFYVQALRHWSLF